MRNRNLHHGSTEMPATFLPLSSVTRYIRALTIAGAASYTAFNNTRHASACKRTPAGFLLPMKFTKPATSIERTLGRFSRIGKAPPDAPISFGW